MLSLLDSMGEIKSVGQIRAWEEATEAVESFDDYTNIKELFKHFFRCSALNRIDCFNFDKAFFYTVPFINDKLDRHYMRSSEDYLVYVCKQHPNATKDFIGWEMNIYNKEKQLFHDIKQFQVLLKLSNACTDIRSLQVWRQVALFDAIIDAEHVSGYIFEWELSPEDPNSLRHKVNKELYKVL